MPTMPQHFWWNVAINALGTIFGGLILAALTGSVVRLARWEAQRTVHLTWSQRLDKWARHVGLTSYAGMSLFAAVTLLVLVINLLRGEDIPLTAGFIAFMAPFGAVLLTLLLGWGLLLFASFLAGLAEQLRGDQSSP